MLDHGVGPLRVVDQVDVIEGDGLGRSRHVRLAGEVFAAKFGSIHDESQVTMVPVGGLFVLCVSMCDDVFTRCVGVEIGVKRIFANPALESWAGPGGSLE